VFFQSGSCFVPATLPPNTYTSSHPYDLYIGPKTVFFWAPMMKWALVGAGVKDLSRPAEKLSLSQNLGE